ncbi:MAG: immunoglobulin domain-containing protein [Opitutaceae bacterium]|nr:immunoglobulin domain-containing protein [Opitutaceae bacterium]
MGVVLPQAHAAIPPAAQTDPLFGKGYLVVTHYPGVTINGDQATATATTTALNEAIADAYANNLVAYFPAGTYAVNDTLKAYTATGKPASVPGAAFATPREHLAIVGSTKGIRPVIKLVDSASGFTNSASPKTILEFMNFNEGQIGNRAQEAPASGYYQMLRSVDVDCGAGNAGAIGVYFNQAQGSSIEDVKVTATGAFAGFKALPGRGAPVVNVEVEGGRYGIDTGGTSNIGTVVAGAVLRNQTISAVRHDSAFFPLVIVGFEITTPPASVQAAVTISGSAKSSGSAIHLIDGRITLGGDPTVAAVDNRASRIFYARNVYVTGSSKLVKSTNANPTITGTGTWQLINEYSYCNQAVPDTDGKIATNIIDGAVTRTPGPLANGEVVSITNDVSAPPADLVSRHAWVSLPSVDDEDAFDAFNAGIAPGNISSEALQNVINTHRKVFLRKGIYFLDGVIGHNGPTPVYGPITLRRDTILFGAARHLTRIEVHPGWDPTSETAMIATDNDAAATTYIGGLTLGVDATDLVNDWFVALDWQAGRNSMVHIGHVYREPAFTNPNPRVTTNPHSLLRIRNGGGGRWYGAGSRKNFTSKDPDGLFRILKVEGTAEPLWMYGLNMEGAAGTDTYAEFSNTRNVRIYAVKTESADLPSGYADKNILLKYVNVTNLAQFGHSAIRDAATDRGTIEFLGSGTDRVLATLICPQTGTVVVNSDTLRENLTGLPADSAGILFPNVVSLYKRGAITAADDAVMSHDAVSYAPVGGNVAPTVQITAPASGATLPLLPTTITATASDSDGTVSLVNFYANGALIGSDATAPYSATWTPSEVGSYTLTALAIDNAGGSTTSVGVTVTTVASAASTELVLNSIGAEDGRVIESTATSEVGGNNFPNATGSTALRMGDDGTNRQFRNIVSFDTSTIPVNAVIVSASLELCRGSGAQGNTGNLGQILVDVRTGDFGTGPALENVDFQSPPTAAQVATMSVPALENQWSIGLLNQAGRDAINRTGGRTQFRVYYAIGDNGNNTQDFIPFFGGASTTAGTRPILRISYGLPPTIVTSPANQTATVGATVTFTVTATDTSLAALSFQWRRDGVAITGNASVQTAALTLTGLTTAVAGSYDCVVSNAFGSGTSAAATLTVAKAPATVALGGLGQIYDGTPRAVTATTSPAGLGVVLTYDGSATAPTNAGSYAVVATIADANYTGSATGALLVAKAAATIAFSNTTQTYDGTPKAVTLTTTPAGIPTSVIYAGSATVPTNAGSYAVAASITDPNYSGSAAGTLTIDRSVATVVLANLSQTYDGTPRIATATTTPDGLAVNLTYDGSTTAPTNAGSYAVAASIADANYRGSTVGTLVVAPAVATIALSGLTQAYDGLPKPVTTSTTPAGLAVSITYDGKAAPPTNPGSYPIVATTIDPNYTGNASGALVVTVTALVRRAPSLAGGLDGSLQVLTAESFTLNGNAWVSGDLLVPGLPTLRLNGNPVYGGTLDGSGSASPSNHQVTLNGNAALRHLVRRTDPLALSTVTAPPAPAGIRNVSIQNAGQSIGDPVTLRNLTLNGNAGDYAVPAGTYGAFDANGSSGFILGEPGATTPAVYNLQNLTLNGNARLHILGPVVLLIANGVSLGGNAIVIGDPEWLTLTVASGGVSLNGSAIFRGAILAPSGTLTINGNATLTGRVASDRLTINGQGLLEQAAP